MLSYYTLLIRSLFFSRNCTVSTNNQYLNSVCVGVVLGPAFVTQSVWVSFARGQNVLVNFSGRKYSGSIFCPLFQIQKNFGASFFDECFGSHLFWAIILAPKYFRPIFFVQIFLRPTFFGQFFRGQTFWIIFFNHFFGSNCLEAIMFWGNLSSSKFVRD